MINNKKEKGITLIALIVTIIILLILAAITIGTAISLIGNAQKAVDVFEKSQKNELDVLAEWEEYLNLQPDKVYPSVASMKEDTELTSGKLVKTLSYWNAEYGGAAYYDIVKTTNLTVDEGKCILLNNGLYAEFHAIDNTVSVSQFGAYGDGEHEDSVIIRKAINAGYGKVKFEKKSYLCDQPIKVSTDNVTILGNGATLVMKENYNYSIDTYRFMYVGGTKDKKLENVTIDNLSIKTGAIVFPNSDAMQVYIENANNITIANCKFEVKEIENDKSRYITNLWIGGNTSQVQIKNNRIINLSNSNRGGNVWLSYGKIQEVVIEGNYMEKSSHDESIAVWQTEAENIMIDKNEFYLHHEKVENPSNVLFTFGKDENDKIKGVKFTNNGVSSSSQSGVFRSKTLDSLLCEGNKIKHEFIFTSASTFWKLFDNETQFEAKNNKIELSSAHTEEIQFSICNTKSTLTDNFIIANLKIRYLVANAKELQCNHNMIQVNNMVTSLFLNSEGNFNDNTFELNANIKNIFQLSVITINQEINIVNNTFHIRYPDTSNPDLYRFIEIYQSKLNNHLIKIEDNTFNTNMEKNSRFLMMNQCTETSPQNIYLTNNTYGNFKKLIFSNSSGYTITANDKIYTSTKTFESFTLD